tara:strand:+ start:4374 stop:5735 length:1362 start_codon:yes stop_codon:yes gene_type:complete
MNKLPNINECSLAIIGLGYVGLPVAIEFALKKKSILDKSRLVREIIGFDINEERINQLKNNIDITKEIDTEILEKTKNIFFTNNPKHLSNAEIYIVTVPTPIDNNKKPDLSLLKKACKTIGLAIKNRKLESIPVVIFESTVYPGATEEICVPIIKKHSGFDIYDGEGNKNRNSFAFGYSPERINPGDKKHRISMIIKVTSGNNEIVSLWVDKLYGSIIDAGTHNAKSIKIAEAAKIIENTQRDLNIALINELSIIFENLNIDTLDVIEAAQTKWNFLPFKPGLVGGHCIGVDPYYLTYKSIISGYVPQVILSGRKINDNVGFRYVDRLIKILHDKGIQTSKLKVLILGFTFKENCPDIRNTGVMNIINALRELQIEFEVFDPLVKKRDALNSYNLNIENEIPKDKKYALIIVAVSHFIFTKYDISIWKSLCTKESIIFDLKGIVPRSLNPIRP